MSQLTCNIECPVCSNTASIPAHTHCAGCGWQFILFSSKPNSAMESRLCQQQQLKKSSFEQQEIQAKNKETCQLKIDEIKPIHEMLRVQYEEVAPEYKALARELTAAKQNYTVEDTSELELRIKQQQQQINLLSAQMPSGYNHTHTPNITLACHYNKITNQVEVEVTDIDDKYKKVNQAVVFAVAFFANEGFTFHEADLIISTEDKQILSFRKGDQIVFNLKYQPPINLLNSNHHQVIHLIANSLSEFIISYGH